MKIVRRIRDMQSLSKGWQRKGQSIGFVPTMGALHEGHLSLVRRARRENRRTVVSIFVNPTQFGPKEDFARYPRPFQKDSALCQKAGVDAVFAPSPSEMYPEDFQTKVSVSKLSRWLCGPFRPGHFDGVAAVVAKLFLAVLPDRAYFGEKDYQQLQVLRALARDLNFPLQVVGCPTVRETDGLALSSRNAYLGRAERSQAALLNQVLKQGKDMIQKKRIRNAARVNGALKRALSRVPGSRLDYALACDPETLEPVRTIGRSVLLALAIRIGKTRLIDNLLVKTHG